MNRRLLVCGALTLVAASLSAPTVSADPEAGGFELTLTCDGVDYDVVVAGNGAWTPAHDLNSTLVGVPIAFGEFSGVFTANDGTEESFTEDPYAKPHRPRTRNIIIDCDYAISGTFPDGSFEGAGVVTIMVPRLH